MANEDVFMAARDLAENEAGAIERRAAQFHYSDNIIRAGGPAADRNWLTVLEHTSAEWSGDLDATMATMSRDEPFQIMYATGLDIRGYDNVRAFYRERMKTFSGQGFIPHCWVVSDKIVVGNGYFSGTPSGVFFGVQTSGKTLCLPMTVWIYFENGLIKGEVAYLDGHELRRQIENGTTRSPTEPLV